MTDHKLTWEPAGWLFGVVTLVILLVFAVVFAGRSDMLVFLAPLVGALAGAWWSVRPDRSVQMETSVTATRVFEGDIIDLRVEVTAPEASEILDVALEIGPEIGATLVEMSRDGNVAVGRWELEAVRWGRCLPGIRIATRGASGLLEAGAHAELSSIAVFPSADRMSDVPHPLDLTDLLGVHLGRRKGEGVEFGGVREYQPGDPQRSVNWAVSARRGKLHVTQRLTEQSSKVVSMIDTSADIVQDGPSSLELSVHGALAVSEAALRQGDRAGVVTAGGVMQWLSPDLGRRHFYQIIETLLDVRAIGGTVPSSASAFPRTMLPRGAVIVVFTPLIDERMVAALLDLRRRGFPLAVVDVLRAVPKPRKNADYDEIAIRMWNIGREGIRYRLSDAGIPVAQWGTGVALDEIMRPMASRPVGGIRR
ncbi:MAG TPA: DUF58 domain-containing protein [Pseudonocardia sp.]|nr:DUF58 domain-containing protein [Pseudonocardia sp.]